MNSLIIFSFWMEGHYCLSAGDIDVCVRKIFGLPLKLSQGEIDGYRRLKWLKC